jgi:hypothetical protein
MQQEQLHVRHPTRPLAKEAGGDNAGFVDDEKIIAAKKFRKVAKDTIVRALSVEHQQAAVGAPERRLLRDQFFGQLVIVRRCIPLIARDR